MEELLDAGVVGATITDGHLMLQLRGGGTVDAGLVLSDLPAATDAVAGVVVLAGDADVIAGTSTTEAVTPFSLAARTATDTRTGLVELATNAEVTTGTDTTRAVTPAGVKNAYQPKSTDLTAIDAITGKTIGDYLGYQSGGWTRRTAAQVATDIAGTGEFLEAYLHNGTSYVDADNTKVYVGPTDPGAVANGSVWYDTTGA